MDRKLAIETKEVMDNLDQKNIGIKQKEKKRFNLRNRIDRLSESSTAKLYIFPTNAVLILAILFPLLYALFLSLTKVEFAQGNLEYTFVGVNNFLEMFRDPRIPKILIQTLTFTLISVVGTVAIGFGIALTIHHGAWGAGLFKRLFLLPWALSNVVNGLMWQWMYSGNNGIINEILSKLGFIDGYKMWLVEEATAMGALIFADIWKSTPFAALLLLAALQTVPKDLYEASKVDGAGAFTQFTKIVLPTIKPVILVVLVTQTMWTLRVFDLIWVLTQGGPMDSTMTLNIYAYENAFRSFNIGYGSALAYVITFITLIFTFIYIRLLGKEN